MSLIRVAPGILVSDKFTVSIPHPDPCWVLASRTDTSAVLAIGGEQLLVFSTEALARSFISAGVASHITQSDYNPVYYTWEKLVEKFGEFLEGIIDHRGEAGFYASVPLKKGI